MPKGVYRDLPLRKCEYCGEEYARKRSPSGKMEAPTHYLQRRFCSRRCKAAAQVKGQNPQTSRRHAAKLMDGGFCIFCTTTVDVVVHHIDGDPLNNERQNLTTVCRSCHSIFHALAKRLV